MANNSPSLSLVNLDPDALTASLILHMQGQSIFKDYNYEGSAMQALLRIMSHNTYLNGFMINMLASESIGIDTAQTRSALISHAKELNYTPRSAYSAVANVTVSFNGSESSYLLQKGQSFATTILNDSYIFTLPDNILATSSNGYFSITTPIYEGVFQADQYIMNFGDETQRFILTNKNVDARSISVVAFEDGSTEGTVFRQATTLLDVNETSLVWFLQATETEGYEVVFGDGVLGRRPKDGSLIVLDYRVTKGSAGNGALVFSPNFNPLTANLVAGTATNLQVTTNTKSKDGAEAESEASIRYNAPRHFQVQERAVGPNDFSIILREQFPEITAVSSYGGEEVDPPRYGRVYIAISIQGVDGLPDSKIEEYTSFLSGRCLLTKLPLFVSPQYTYIQVKTNVIYNINVTRLTPQNIRALVADQISNFNEASLSDFRSTLRYSRLVTTIDDSDTSILGNETDLQIYKKLTPQKSAPQNIDVNFNMALMKTNQEVNTIHPFVDEHTITSTPFTFNGDTVWLDDDGQGNVYIKRRVGTNAEFVKKVGTIDYDKGKVQLASFQIDNYIGTYFKVYAKPAEKDITSDQATILSIESDEVTITIEGVRE